MKKYLSFIIVFTMLISAFPFGAFAEDSSGLKKAILSVKNRIEISEELSEFSSDVLKEENMVYYNLFWSTPYEEYKDQKSTQITINSNGDITSYNIYSDEMYRNENAGFAAYSDTEIKNIALQWLSKINPSWISELPEEYILLKSNVSIYDTMSYVTFKRYIKNLPFCGDRVRITVNNRTGTVTRMYSSWTYSDAAPSPDNIITTERSGEIFLEKSPMVLQYIYSEKNEKAIPVYMPKNKNYLIDAATGEEFTPFLNYRKSGLYAADEAAATEGANYKESEKGLTINEINNLNEIEGLLSQDVLCSTAENLKNTGINNAEFISCRYESSKNFDKEGNKEIVEYTAFLEYINHDKNQHFYVSFNAKTGELISYNSYFYDRYNDETVKISNAKAQEAAQKFVNEYSGCNDENLRAEEEKEEDENNKNIYYYTNFYRYENGIIYKQNNVSVSVDKITGNINSYYKYWDNNLIFESSDNIISSEEAENILLEKAGMVLSYEKAQGESQAIPDISLMYQLNQDIPSVIDAKTGEIINNNGDIYTPENEALIYPTDISGHYGEEMIKKLIYSGILSLSEDEKFFYPDEFINKKDLISFVSGLKTGYIPYYENNDFITRTAKHYDIIDDTVDLSEDAVRETGVEFIIRALGYKKIADLKDIFITTFADNSQISDDMKGYIAIAQGLGIIKGDENNCFNPKEKLTRADAAIMIYNYLAK